MGISACPAPTILYTTVHSRNHSFHFSHFPPFHPFHFGHDATTVADLSQINNVTHEVGRMVVTALIIVAVCVIVLSLAIFLTIGAHRRRRISDRMAKERRGVVDADYPSSPADLFRPQYSHADSKGLWPKILRKFGLPRKSPSSINRMLPEKIVRWDPHARHPADSIQCTKNDGDGNLSFYSGSRHSSISLPFSGLSCLQNQKGCTSPSRVSLQPSEMDEMPLENHSISVLNNLRRPDKALIVMGAPPVDHSEILRDRFIDTPRPIVGNQKSTRSSVSTTYSRGRALSMSAPAYPAPILPSPRSRRRALRSASFLSGGTIPEFKVPFYGDDGTSSRMVTATEGSFAVSVNPDKRADASPATGSSENHRFFIYPASGVVAESHGRLTSDDMGVQPAVPSWRNGQTLGGRL